jgi:hypothetical protein
MGTGEAGVGGTEEQDGDDSSVECLWCRVEGAGEGGGDGAGVARGEGQEGVVGLKILEVSDLLASSQQLCAEYEALPP